jgi:hypothetical protein
MSTAQLILGNDPAFQLASALEAVRKAEEDFSAQKADHKARMEALYADVNRLKLDILTGQKQLPLEPITEQPDDTLQERVQIANDFISEINAIQEREASQIPTILDAENEDTKAGL